MKKASFINCSFYGAFCYSQESLLKRETQNPLQGTEDTYIDLCIHSFRVWDGYTE